MTTTTAMIQAIDRTIDLTRAVTAAASVKDEAALVVLKKEVNAVLAEVREIKATGDAAFDARALRDELYDLGASARVSSIRTYFDCTHDVARLQRMRARLAAEA